jgi:hypothetical protein
LKRDTNSGPATPAIPYIPPTIPVYIGRLCNGTVAAIINKAPVNIPAAPIPATALPMMSVVDVGATPQRSEPSSNHARAQRKIHFRG